MPNLYFFNQYGTSTSHLFLNTSNSRLLSQHSPSSVTLPTMLHLNGTYLMTTYSCIVVDIFSMGHTSWAPLCDEDFRYKGVSPSFEPGSDTIVESSNIWGSSFRKHWGVNPLVDGVTVAQRTVHWKEKTKDFKAFYLIHQCVDVVNIEKVGDCTYLKEAWEILEKS